MKLRSLLFLAGTTSAVLGSLGYSGEKIFDVSGVIRAPLDATDRLVIAHQDIPGFMPAMTMAFSVANPAEAITLKAGDRVQFRLHVSDTSSAAGDFLVIGQEAASPATVPAERPGRSRLNAGDLVPPFSLLTQAGKPLSVVELRGQVTLVTFIFTRCPIPEYCPAMAARFGKIQQAILADAKLAGRVQLLSITLDPEFDRPEILKAYGEAVGANFTVWQFATGEKEQIAALAKSFAVFTERKGAVLEHTLCTALIGADGRVVEFWRGNGWPAKEAVDAIAAAAQW